MTVGLGVAEHREKGRPDFPAIVGGQRRSARAKVTDDTLVPTRLHQLHSSDFEAGEPFGLRLRLAVVFVWAFDVGGLGEIDETLELFVYPAASRHFGEEAELIVYVVWVLDPADDDQRIRGKVGRGDGVDVFENAATSGDEGGTTRPTVE